MLKDKLKNQVATSPCAVSLDAAQQEVVIVEKTDSDEFQISRVPQTEDRAANITASEIRSVVSGWSAHTDKAPPIIGNEGDDKQILKALIGAASVTPGSSDLRYDFTRTGANQIVLTQAPITQVEETLQSIRNWATRQQSKLLGNETPGINLETSARVIARLWLDGPVHRSEIDQFSTALFLVVGEDGYAVGLWGANSGFIYETEEPFRPDASEDQIAWHIHNNVLKMTSASSLSKLALTSITHLVFSSVSRLQQPLMAHLMEAAQLRSVRLESLKLKGTPSDVEAEETEEELDQPTALAIGALTNDARIPRINLSTNLESKLLNLSEAEQSIRATEEKVGRARAALALLIPLIVVAAFLLSAWYFKSAEAWRLRVENVRGKATIGHLKQENSDYEAAKTNFAIIGGLINQITKLRDKQAGSYRLLVDLNQRWPQDPTWYVSEVNAKGGQVEIKGKTRNEQAITAFTKALENSAGLFTNISVSNSVAGVSNNSSPMPQAQSPPSNVLDFTIRANYSQLNGTTQPPATAGGAAGSQPSAQQPMRAPTTLPNPPPPQPAVSGPIKQQPAGGQ